MYGYFFMMLRAQSGWIRIILKGRGNLKHHGLSPETLVKIHSMVEQNRK
jgi:hypothetical protein